MTTDPTNIDLPTPTDEPPPPNRRGRRRHALVLGAAVLALVMASAAVVATRGEQGRAAGTSAPATSTGSTSSTSTTLLVADAAGTNADASTAPGGGGGGAVTPQLGRLAFAPWSLDFDADTSELSVTLRNLGPVAADWSTEAAPAQWLAVAPSAGTLAPGEEVDVSVVVDRTELGNGSHDVDLEIVSGASFDQGHETVSVTAAVEKAEVLQVVSNPVVLCAQQSPGAGPKVAVVYATGVHLEKADTIWARFDTPGNDIHKHMDYDEAHDRWVTTFSTTALGFHQVFSSAAGNDAVEAGAGPWPINVIWCP